MLYVVFFFSCARYVPSTYARINYLFAINIEGSYNNNKDGGGEEECRYA